MQNPFSPETYLERSRPTEEDVRGAFFRDQTAIIHSQAFRRLKHKTQVFFAPSNDHVCTRIEHVLHVATIAKTICKGLNQKGLNLDVEMAFAIGLGHDLGHTPFGHDGEAVLNKLMGGHTAFAHEMNSYRIVQHLARDGRGLNLTFGVKDGIMTHNGEHFEQYLLPSGKKNSHEQIKTRSALPNSLEGCITRFSDKIAYLGRDIEDALTLHLIRESDIPGPIRKYLGTTNSQIINKLVNDMIEHSAKVQKIGFSDGIFERLKELRTFNYKSIYLSPLKKQNAEKAKQILITIFEYLLSLAEKNNQDLARYTRSESPIDREFGNYLQKMAKFYGNSTSNRQIVCDYVAGMTDFYAIDAFKQISLPNY